MNSKKLEKLKEQVFKKADSKLYIPLAEEYKKINMIEEAVKVLKYCIGKHPNYMSARVALGKIYMEQGYLQNAIEEFETVVMAIPDNLLSHRKLAQLYQDRSLQSRGMTTGDTTRALASLEKILLLNPNDEDAQESIRKLKTQLLQEVKTDDILDETIYAEAKTEKIIDEAQDEQVQIPNAVEEQVPNNVISEEVTNELINASASNDTPADIEHEPDTEDLSAQEAGELIKQVEQSTQMPPLQQQLHDIDQYIVSEHFLGAIMAYNKLLKQYPDSNEIRQRREEALRYARLLKKDETVLVQRLDTFYNRLKDYKKA
ncbi:MAG: hypothetical protein HQL03_10215 [Nitrospirae bacterium]|nr:hypothetical protein [Nitrospirota bacterium]MBF0591611.1 hypothetical protein [Nitrospirota bacterium]